MAKRPKNAEATAVEPAQLVTAVGYMRTSSASNVGADKDSDKRQRAAIQRFAKSSGYVIADDDIFYDAAVRGTDPIETRAGFAALLQRIAGNGCRTVIVEDASRFARDLTVQELGIAALVKLGVTVLTANGENLTATDDPMRVAVRQIFGAIAQLEKNQLVNKLRGARERKRAAGERVEGRKPMHELRPDVVREAKRLRRVNPATGEVLSFARIAEELARLGHLATPRKAGDTPKSFGPRQVQLMCQGPMPERPQGDGE